MSFVPKTMWELMNKELTRQAMRIEPGLLPKGGTMLIGGQTKIGKTFVVAEFCRALITARSLFSLESLSAPEEARVLYVEGEVGEWGTQKRARTAYSDIPERQLKNLFYITKEEAHAMKLDAPMHTSTGFTAWCTAVEKIAPEVLIIDPFAAFHTSDENDATEMEKVLQRIEKLKAIHPARQMSVILVHHTTKSPGDRDPLDHRNIRGSGKICDRVDTILMLDKKKNLKNLPHKAWELAARFVIRQDEGIDADLRLHFNERADCRVRFAAWKTDDPGGLPPLKIVNMPPDPKVPTTTGTQLSMDISNPFG